MKFIFIALLFLVTNSVVSQNLGFLDENLFKVVYNERYGAHKRNTFDIISPNSENPTSLVIYIHGGGFKHGSKDKLYQNKQDISFFINHNISVATLNYRYRKDNDSIGIKACINDVKRAIQFIRFNAAKYNINKNKIACYGNSAGAGMSLYFALQDDLAIPNNTTLLGESTKISCAGALSTQATYDVFKWEEYIPWLPAFVWFKKTHFFKMAANFYGFKTYESFEPFRNEITNSLDMLQMVDKEDPPIYLQNLLEDTIPINNNVIQHHKKHALVMAEKLDRYQVENYVFTDDNKEEQGQYPIYMFIAEHLK